MQIEPQIDFQGMEATSEHQNKILRQIARLEDRYGHATACRVVVKGPGAHHRTGGLYEVNIHMILPDSARWLSHAHPILTNASRISISRSTTHSSTPDGVCKTRFAACAEK